MFDLVHLEQEKGWQPEGSAITIYTNPFFAQQEQGLIISPLKAIEDAKRVQHLNAVNLTAGIRNKKGY